MIGNKIGDKSRRYQKIHHIIVQKQLKQKYKIQDFIEKYLRKDISYQKERQQIIDDLRLI